MYIAGLVRHLSKGWSEEQLVSGRVAVLGREEADFALAGAMPTLWDLALAVQDRQGVPAVGPAVVRRAFDTTFAVPMTTASRHSSACVAPEPVYKPQDRDPP